MHQTTTKSDFLTLRLLKSLQLITAKWRIYLIPNFSSTFLWLNSYFNS